MSACAVNQLLKNASWRRGTRRENLTGAIIVSIRDDYVWRKFDMPFSKFLVRAILNELEDWDEPMVFDQPGENSFEPYPETIFPLIGVP
jgi:hypothetical protein